MAQSRLEKVATIFKRASHLQKAQNLPDEYLPLWYDIYKNFPPKYEPRYNRKYEKKTIKPIFYAEDIIRAKFQKDFAEASNHSLHTQMPSVTENFLQIYENVVIRERDLPEDKLYSYAVEEYKKIRALKKFSENETSIRKPGRGRTRSARIDVKFNDFFNTKE